MDKAEVLKRIETIEKDLSYLITDSLLCGGIPQRLINIETSLEEIKNYFTQCTNCQ